MHGDRAVAVEVGAAGWGGPVAAGKGERAAGEGGKGVDSSIEALGSQKTFAACVKVTRPGGTISNVGYHGDGDTVPIPRLEWGVGMGDKTIRTALCPGGSERMGRLMRLIAAGRVDPLPLTTHRFLFKDIERAFKMMQTKEDGMIKPLISFAQ